jgi:hypothetical protein
MGLDHISKMRESLALEPEMEGGHRLERMSAWVLGQTSAFRGLSMTLTEDGNLGARHNLCDIQACYGFVWGLVLVVPGRLVIDCKV